MMRPLEPEDLIQPWRDGSMRFRDATDARIAAMALHEAGDQLFRAASIYAQKRALDRAREAREARLVQE